jgi:hypothetical protein
MNRFTRAEHKTAVKPIQGTPILLIRHKTSAKNWFGSPIAKPLPAV